MPNPYFKFKQFTIYHDRCAMKITTDACLFGSWCAEEILSAGNEEQRTLLDIGAGSGILSLMIAQKNNCHINAIEIDADAAQQAKENIVSTPWKENISVQHGDVLHFSFPYVYDIIVSNPPFYENELISDNRKKNTAHHGEGLKLSELAALIKQQLAPLGNFFLLLPFKRAVEAVKILEKENLFVTDKLIISQSEKHPPFRLMIKGGHQKTETREKQISITNADRQYTKEFTRFLQDYYLHL